MVISCKWCNNSNWTKHIGKFSLFLGAFPAPSLSLLMEKNQNLKVFSGQTATERKAQALFLLKTDVSAI